MRPSLSRLVASSLAGALLQPTFVTTTPRSIDPYEISIANERPEIREQMINFGVDLTKRFYNNEFIGSSEVPHSMIRRTYQSLAGEKQTIELRDIAQRMAEGSTMYIDNWMMGVGLTKKHLPKWWFGREEREARMLRNTNDKLYSNIARQAILEPKKDVEKIIKDALLHIDVQAVRNSLEYNWASHDWSQGMKFDSKGKRTRHDDSNRRHGDHEAYFFTNTQEALAIYSDMKSKVQQEYLIYLDVRTSEIASINGFVKRVRNNKDLILEKALLHDVPLGPLAYIIGMYRPENPMPRITSNSPNQQKNDQENPVTLQIRQLTRSLLPQLRRIYTEFDNVVISERGATPIAYVLDAMMDSLGLSKKEIKKFKFSSKDKIAESFAYTDESIDLEERLFLQENGDLRSDYETARLKIQSPQSEEKIAQQKKALLARVNFCSKINDSIYERALPFQVKRANEKLGKLEGKTLLFEDYQRSGATVKNMQDVFAKLDIDINSVEILPIVGSRTIKNGMTLVRFNELYDLKEEGHLHDYLSWKIDSTIGISYGMDRRVKKAEKLFERYLDNGSYELPEPGLEYFDKSGKKQSMRTDYFSHKQKQTIVNQFIQDTLLIHEDSVPTDFSINVEKKAYAILDNDRVRQRPETTARTLYKLGIDSFREMIKRTVNDELSNLCSQFGKEAVKNYTLGINTNSFAQHRFSEYILGDSRRAVDLTREF